MRFPWRSARLWTLDLTKAIFPDQAAAGQIHGKDFVCRQAVLQNGLLVLRTGRGWQSVMAANVFISTNAFSTNAAEILSGGSFEVNTNHAGFAPGVSFFWREGDLRVMQMFTNGFAMKLDFGKISGTKLPGKIYLCLPDEAKSCVAGTFTAEIQKISHAPSAVKRRPPAMPGILAGKRTGRRPAAPAEAGCIRVCLPNEGKHSPWPNHAPAVAWRTGSRMCPGPRRFCWAAWWPTAMRRNRSF